MILKELNFSAKLVSKVFKSWIKSQYLMNLKQYKVVK